MVFFVAQVVMLVLWFTMLPTLPAAVVFLPAIVAAALFAMGFAIAFAGIWVAFSK